jgi:hypothetical protein
MASEAVQVIISADDQASQKFAQVAANAEQTIGRVKASGEKLKGLAGVGGALTKMLGGTELGGQIAQIGELTEKVNQFGQIAKMGGAGAMIFKAGLAGLVAVMSIELGKSIGNVIFGMDEFEKKLERARQKSDQLNSVMMQMRDIRFGSEFKDIQILPDLEQQLARTHEFFSELKLQEQAYIETIAANAKKAKKLRAEFAITNENKEMAAQLDQQSNQLQEQINQLRQQQRQLKDSIDDRSRAVTQAFNSSMESLAKETVLLTQGESAAERWSLKRQGMSDEMISWIVGIREQNEELKKANAEKEKAAQQAAKVADAYRNSAASIVQQRVALEDGAEAGRKFQLVQQGMSDAEAERIAQEESALKSDQMIKQETQSLELRRIALEKGNEAARAQALINQGMDADSAERLSREESLLTLEERKNDLAMRRVKLEEAAKVRILIGQGVAVDAAEKMAAEATKLELLLKQGIDFDTAKKMAADEAALDAEEKKVEAAERVNESRKSILANLEREKILIQQGEQAARSFALQQEGFAKDEADRIAAEEARLDKLKKEKEQKLKTGADSSLTAFESRLLTRGRAVDPMLELSKEQLAEQKKANTLLERQLEQKPLRVKVAGTLKA